MKKIYDKNELHFALIWMGVYIVLMSIGDSVSETIGIAKIVTAPVCIIFTLILYLWICKHELNEKYGLCPFWRKCKKILIFCSACVIDINQSLVGISPESDFN